jgi:hypothetical protein
VFLSETLGNPHGGQLLNAKLLASRNALQSIDERLIKGNLKNSRLRTPYADVDRPRGVEETDEVHITQPIPFQSLLPECPAMSRGQSFRHC